MIQFLFFHYPFVKPPTFNGNLTNTECHFEDSIIDADNVVQDIKTII